MDNKTKAKVSAIKDAQALKNYFANKSRAEKTVAMDKISAGCMVPRSTVNNWFQSLCRIPALHKCKIEEILGEKIFFEIG